MLLSIFPKDITKDISAQGVLSQKERTIKAFIHQIIVAFNTCLEQYFYLPYCLFLQPAQADQYHLFDLFHLASQQVLQVLAHQLDPELLAAQADPEKRGKLDLSM